MIPHYINRSGINSNAGPTNYTFLADSTVFNQNATPLANATISVANANYNIGDTTNTTQAATWVNGIRALILDTNIQLVVTSSLHAATMALCAGKNVKIMRVGSTVNSNSVLGNGTKFKEFIETYATPNTFNYVTDTLNQPYSAFADGQTYDNVASIIDDSGVSDGDGTTYQIEFQNQNYAKAFTMVPYQAVPKFASYFLVTGE